MGNKVNDPGTSQKSYWKIINKVMNKCRAPKIPPLINSRFILDCKEKAKLFSDFFAQQCNPIINNSVLPNFLFLTNNRIDQITIRNDEIISLIQNINPNNKATGSDSISRQMLLLCDDSVILPLKILLTLIYPDTWKLANMTPIISSSNLWQNL